MKKIFLIERQEPTQGSHGKGPWMGYQSCGASTLVGGMFRVGQGWLTRMSASMISLQICRLEALVTSRNRSLVVFLILKRNWEDFRKEPSYHKQTPSTLMSLLQKTPWWHTDPDMASPRGAAHERQQRCR